MKVIGITGHARAGKDTVANIIIEANDDIFYPIIKESFAYPIKRATAAFFDKDIESLELYKSDQEDLYGVNIRKMYQQLGQAARSLNVDVYCNLLEARLKKYENDNLLVLITDVRFLNEVYFLRDKYNAKIIKVVNDRLDFLDPLYNDPSEQEINKITADYYIINHSTIEDLKLTTIDLIFREKILEKE